MSVAATLLFSASAQAQTSPAPTSDKIPLPSAAPLVAPAPAGKGARVMMLRWFTSDVARAEKFYQAVFDMTTVQRMGDNVRIMMFPGGAMPGMILVQSSDPKRLRGSFIAQVADVKATLAIAAANGGKLLNTQFSQNIHGQQASSSHFEDADGNVIELLQIRAAGK
ncbi:VOC family protein [Sphingobium sufflavum]|uniref:VOC family protein n=1 Tax=Sphingobium sufflavum TaxID=1129547 RepID=UPI001F428D07|nr:VOC family protein [Sphingobium sufflavum]